jgi:hypothetical protein
MSGMAERKETSDMTSLQELLRDAQKQEEQEKQQAAQRARDEEQRRLDEQRKRQQEGEARLRAEEDERLRRLHEEQRRQAEIQAMQQATVQRAQAETEAQARLAEMAARQDHERQMHLLGQDKHKKRLTAILAALGAVVVIGAVVAGIAVKTSNDRAAAAQAQLRAMQDEKDRLDQEQAKLRADLANTQDPVQIAALQQQLADEQARESALKDQMTQNKKTGRTVTGAGAGAKRGPAPAKPNCAPGDPLCSNL